jgi:sialidase-1
MASNLGGLRTAAVFVGVTAVVAASGWIGDRLRPTTGERVAAASCTASVPFQRGYEGYHTFRIPAVVVTGKGTLLAFAEGRKGAAGDSGEIDTVARRSSDGGCTWGPLIVAADHGTDTIGNPAPIVTSTGRIVLVSVHNGGSVTETQIRRGEVSAADARRVFVRHSDDDGATWSQEREITDQTKNPEWRWYATTPGHAFQLKHGPHAGRLVIPANHSIPPTGSDTGTEGKYNGGHDIYSDDLGETWHIGYVDDNPDGYVNVNETTGTELPDGRIYFNTRNDATSPGHRADAYSSDGGATLDLPFRPNATLVAPVVESSVLQLDDPDLLLFSGPSEPATRAAMSVRRSRDQGVTWDKAYTVSGVPTAYSDLVRVDGATVGLLYETGNFSAYETITFRRIPISSLATS